MAAENDIKQLLERYINDEFTEQEKSQLFAIINTRPDVDWYALLEPTFVNTGADATFTPEKWQPVLAAILKDQSLEKKKSKLVPFYRKWWSVAAMLTILLGAGYLFYQIKNTNTPIIDKPVIAQAAKTDLPPGGDKAVLTTGDGHRFILDSAHGHIVQSGNLIVNNDNGALDYKGKASVVENHTLSTPRGGQYKLQLPDGTNVWLNAASSITYPTAFKGPERNVTITGEVYFEVAKNAAKPFKVQVNHMEIAVLGTHFNVNAYSDEANIQTTLLEGSVKVATGGNIQLLAPGQQAKVNGNAIQLFKNINTDEIMSWKNGYFYFESVDLAMILREFSRWYDIDIAYEGAVPKEKFFVIIKRNSSLAAVLKALQANNVQFKIDGKKLTVKSIK